MADASAVQFTRHPEGIAGALKKIAVYSDGARMQAPTEEVNHMLFGEATARSLFATHPPLTERIRAIEPDFEENELAALAARLQRAEASGEPLPAAAPTPAGGAAFDVDSLIDRIGRVDGHTLAAAVAITDSLPAPLLDAALPSLKRRSPKQLETFAGLVAELSDADHRISAFEFLLTQVLRGYLRDVQQLPNANGNIRLDQCYPEAATTLAALAHFGKPIQRNDAKTASPPATPTYTPGYGRPGRTKAAGPTLCETRWTASTR